MADPAAVLTQMLDFYDLAPDAAAIEHAVARAFESGRTRLKKGITGRGAEELSETQKARIAALARHFPNVDFACIGLDGFR